MDGKKTLITAGIVGVSGVALAYLGHSYLVEKDESKTKMEEAADTVGSGGGFMKFLWGSDNEQKTEPIEMQNVKKNVKIGVSGIATDEVEEGEAIKENVSKAISAFSGFFRSKEDSNNDNNNTKEE